jgi:hypothetical protein
MLVSTGNIDLPSEKMMVRTLVSNVNGVYSNSYLCHKTTAREGGAECEKVASVRVSGRSSESERGRNSRNRLRLDQVTKSGDVPNALRGERSGIQHALVKYQLGAVNELKCPGLQSG